MGPFSYRFGILITILVSFGGRALVLVTGVLLAKSLAPAHLGRFFSDQALVLIGAGVVNLGIGQGYRQLVSRNPELRASYLLPTICLRIGAMLLYFGGFVVYAKLVDRASADTIVVGMATLLFFLIELFLIDLQIRRCYGKAAVLHWCKDCCLFAAAIVFLCASHSYEILVFSYCAVAFLVVIFGLFLVAPQAASLRRCDYGTLIKTSIPFAAALFAYSLTSYWGISYVREVLGEEQAGYYCVPLKLYQMGLVVAMSVSGVILPLYHRLAATKDFRTYVSVFNRLIRVMWLIAGLIAGTCSLIPDVLVRILAKEEYMAAVSVFPWIGFSVMFRLLAMPAGNILESVDKQWYRVLIQSIGAAFCLIAVTFAVPRWGILGAAWTVFAVDLWLMVGYWLTTCRFANAVVSMSRLLAPAVAFAAIFAIATWFMHGPGWFKLAVFYILWLGYVGLHMNLREEIGVLLKIVGRKAS